MKNVKGFRKLLSVFLGAAMVLSMHSFALGGEAQGKTEGVEVEVCESGEAGLPDTPDRVMAGGDFELKSEWIGKKLDKPFGLEGRTITFNTDDSWLILAPGEGFFAEEDEAPFSENEEGDKKNERTIIIDVQANTARLDLKMPVFSEGQNYRLKLIIKKGSKNLQLGIINEYYFRNTLTKSKADIEKGIDCRVYKEEDTGTDYSALAELASGGVDYWTFDLQSASDCHFNIDFCKVLDGIWYENYPTDLEELQKNDPDVYEIYKDFDMTTPYSFAGFIPPDENTSTPGRIDIANDVLITARVEEPGKEDSEKGVLIETNGKKLFINIDSKLKRTRNKAVLEMAFKGFPGGSENPVILRLHDMAIGARAECKADSSLGLIYLDKDGGEINKEDWGYPGEQLVIGLPESGTGKLRLTLHGQNFIDGWYPEEGVILMDDNSRLINVVYGKEEEKGGKKTVLPAELTAGTHGDSGDTEYIENGKKLTLDVSGFDTNVCFYPKTLFEKNPEITLYLQGNSNNKLEFFYYAYDSGENKYKDGKENRIKVENASFIPDEMPRTAVFSYDGQKVICRAKDRPLSEALTEEEKKILTDKNAPSASKNAVYEKLETNIEEKIVNISGNTVYLNGGKSINADGKHYLSSIDTNLGFRYDGRTHVGAGSLKKASNSKIDDVQVTVRYLELDNAVTDEAAFKAALANNGNNWVTIDPQYVTVKLKNSKNATVDYLGAGLVEARKSCYIASIKVNKNAPGISNVKGINKVLKNALKPDLDLLKKSTAKLSEEETRGTVCIPIYPAFIGISDGNEKTFTPAGNGAVTKYVVTPGVLNLSGTDVKSVKNCRVAYTYKNVPKEKAFTLKYSSKKNMDFVKEVILSGDGAQGQLTAYGNYYGVLDMKKG